MKFFKSLLLVLALSSTLLGSVDEKYVVFSFPKSGTHFLKAFYTNLTNKPIWHDHVHHYESFSIDNLLEKYHDTKILFPYRDPRDALVSYVFWIDMLLEQQNFGWLHRFGHEEWGNWSMERKLEEILTGQRQNVMLQNIDKLSDLVERFSTEPQVCVVRFEDFIGPKAGGNQETQNITMQKVASFILDKELDAKTLEKMLEVSWGDGSTFNNPKIGKWREYFTDHITCLFKHSPWNEALIKLGYELDDEW